MKTEEGLVKSQWCCWWTQRALRQRILLREDFFRSIPADLKNSNSYRILNGTCVPKVCVFGFSTSVPIATSRQHNRATAHKFQSVWIVFENVFLFIYCAYYAFLLIDVLIVSVMPQTIRTGWLLSVQQRTGYQHEPTRRMLRPLLLQLFHNN